METVKRDSAALSFYITGLSFENIKRGRELRDCKERQRLKHFISWGFSFENIKRGRSLEAAKRDGALSILYHGFKF